MRYRLVIFDWDGTLMDSAEKIVRCFVAAAREVNLPIPTEPAIRAIIGLGLHEAVAVLFPGASQGVRDDIVERYREHFSHLDNTEMKLFPGVKEGLEELFRWGHQLAVATGKARRGLRRVLEDTETAGLFAATRCVDEARSKPDPQMILDLLAATSIPPHEALMVGDTTYDLEMACRARVDALAVSYGVHDREALLRHAPRACLDSFGEVCSWIRDSSVAAIS